VSSDIATSQGGSVQLDIRQGYPVLINHEKITDESRLLATQLLGSGKVEDMDIRMTAEDFAWFTQSIPGMMYRLGVRNPHAEEHCLLHTPGFRADEAALKTGISLLAYLAIELPKKHPV